MHLASQGSLAVLLLLLLRHCTAAASAMPVPTPAELSESTATARNSSSRRAVYLRTELLLRQIVEECVRRQDTVLQLGPHQQLQVLPSLPDNAPCPPLDIALRGSERGVGSCTDVALYVIHAGARIIPLLQAEEMTQYNSRCANRTARMFLETMYHEWLSPRNESLHVMQVNSEHLFKVDDWKHRQMHLFLCKTHFCFRLMQQHIQQQHWNSSVWYIGHTSSDVLVTSSPQPLQQQQQQQRQQKEQQEQQRPAKVAADYSQFLHVRGKSGLKHSRELLDCWVKHPEFPLLTVVGNSPTDEPQTQKALLASNIRLLPKPGVGPKQQQQQQQEKEKEAAGAAVEAPALPGAQPLGRALFGTHNRGCAAAAAAGGGGAGSSSTDTDAHMQVGNLQSLAEQQQQQQQSRQQQGPVQGNHRRLQGGAASLQEGSSLLAFNDIRALQVSSGLHLCPSEREGFGHYLNEARAAAAFVITTDHPPMSDLIRPEFGLLITPQRTGSYEDWQALSGYADINAYLDPDIICAAVEKVMSMPVEERAAKGKVARRQYLLEKRAFVRKVRRLRGYLAKWRQNGMLDQAN